MAFTIDTVAQQVRTFLLAAQGPAGREQVRVYLQDVVSDQAFAREYLDDSQPQRRVLYEDTELGFAILGHVFKEARRTQPHDHGVSWAIYGQVAGVTIMDGWDVIEPAEPGGKPGTVTLRDSIELRPGNVRVYNENEIHSPRRDGPAKLIRIEGNPKQTAPGRVWQPV
jgi:predicted metal-dependent enzyme (double-stranded beta helix superfamily)